MQLTFAISRRLAAEQIFAVGRGQRVGLDCECQKRRIALFETWIQADQFRFESHRADACGENIARIEHLRIGFEKYLLVAQIRQP